MNTAVAKKAPAISPEQEKIRKIALVGLGLAVVGGGAYYAYDQFQKSKNTTVLTPPAATVPVPAVVGGQSTATWVEGVFPLKQGDYNNNKVYRMQKALHFVGDAADGDFGPATAAALTAKGYPVIVDENTYNRILGGTSGSATTPAFNASVIAQAIHAAASNRNLQGALAGLKQMKSVADYSAVNTEYKKIGLVSTTLVTHLLANAYTFTSEADKQQIRNEFLRMGLKYNGSTWSLSGLSGLGNVQNRLVKTTTPTAVKDMDGKVYNVPEHNILGTEIITDEEGMTFVLTANNVILMATSGVLTYTK